MGWIGWMMALLAAADDDLARDAILRHVPGATAAQIEIAATPLPGLLEVAMGTRVMYASADGRFLLAGPLYALASGQNLTEQRQAVQRRQLLAATTLAPRVVYPAAQPRFRVTVVTNVDCPYCRQLHSQLSDYLALGITLEYVLTPFGGPGSTGYLNTAALLCADDPESAITAAMGGAAGVAATGCERQLGQHIALARQLGASTTPNLILPDGRLIAGYKSPQQLLQALADADF